MFMYMSFLQSTHVGCQHNWRVGFTCMPLPLFHIHTPLTTFYIYTWFTCMYLYLLRSYTSFSMCVPLFARVVIPDIVVMRFPFCTSLMNTGLGKISRREYFAVGNFMFQMCAKFPAQFSGCCAK